MCEEIPEQNQYLTELIKKCIQNAELKKIKGHEISYFLPLKSASKFEELFQVLEQKSHLLGIDYFGLSMTTLEEFFTKLCN